MTDGSIPTTTDSQDGSLSTAATGPDGVQAGEVVATGERRLALRERLLGRYQVFGAREGGFGVVYFVDDLETGQEYAVKTYKPELRDSILDIKEFQAEAEFWINLEPHPNIAKAYFLRVVQGVPFLFIEYVGGPLPSLRDRLEASKPDGFHPGFAVTFAYQLCLGMEFANQKGEIAHLDLKPENILVTENDVVKVTDFGLAHRVRVARGKYPIQERGSWPYAPPERFRGEPEDSRSDLYAFGVILYEMLTNKLPYPFDLNKDPRQAYRQLLSFHAERGMNKITEQLYYEGMPGVKMGRIGIILSACLDHWPEERYRDFGSLRELLEYEYNLVPPDALLEALSDGNLRNRALSLARIGRTGQALDLMNRLLQERPGDAQLWLDTARIYQARGNEKMARRFLLRAQQLDPNVGEVPQLLEG